MSFISSIICDFYAIYIYVKFLRIRQAIKLTKINRKSPQLNLSSEIPRNSKISVRC